MDTQRQDDIHPRWLGDSKHIQQNVLLLTAQTSCGALVINGYPEVGSGAAQYPTSQKLSLLHTWTGLCKPSVDKNQNAGHAYVIYKWISSSMRAGLQHRFVHVCNMRLSLQAT